MAVVLEASDVRFAYAQHEVLRGVSLSVEAGEFVALVGPNGSGKSTLLRVLLGLAEPQSGHVRLFGAPPRSMRPRWRLGYVPQRPALGGDLPATVGELVAAGRLARSGWWRRFGTEDQRQIAHAIASVGLEELRDAQVSDLSGGQQQRAFIAKAFVGQPELLVLDEPVAGVDAESQAQFRDALVHLRQEHGAAVLLVSHELGAVADDLDRVIVLRHGGVYFDGKPESLSEAGVSLGVHRDDLPLWLEQLG
jgi:zinc transport system ATP-binding protein